MDVKIEIQTSLKNICRTCLVENGDLRNIFDLNNPNSETQMSNMSKMLEICTSLQLHNNDGLPPSICSECETKLQNAYDFRQLALKSDITLRNYISLESFLPSKSDDKISQNDNLQLEEVTEFLINADGDIIEELTEKNDHLDHLDPPHANSDYEPGEQEEDSETEYKKVKRKKKTRSRKGVRGYYKARTAIVNPDEVNQVLEEAKKKHQEKRECRLCGFICSNARGLSLHMSHIHKEMKNRWCPLCYMEVDDLPEHKKEHNKDKLYKCPFCEKAFRAQGHLTEHLRGHSGERPHKCSICKKGFLSARHLRVHMRIHTGEKPFECDICNKRFTQKGGLQSHMAIHKSKKTYKCDICGEEWSKLNLLTDHLMQSGHTNSTNIDADLLDVDEESVPKDLNINHETTEELYLEDLIKEKNIVDIQTETTNDWDTTVSTKEIKKKEGPKYVAKIVKDVMTENKLCGVCGKTFRLANKLRLHMRIHTGDTPYTCQFCNKHFSTRSQLVVHERTHTGEKPHICHVCGKGFAQSSVLNTHMRLHTGRPEECLVCGQRFCRPTELRLHMRKHTGEKPYLCPECGQSFIQSSHLKEHLKTHSDERPYQCTHCSRAFKQKTTLRSHIRIHTGEKPYRCTECPYRCRQSYSLTQHMRQHSKAGKRNHICLICLTEFPNLTLLNAHAKSKCVLNYPYDETKALDS